MGRQRKDGTVASEKNDVFKNKSVLVKYVCVKHW